MVLGEVARIDGMLDMVLAEMRATKAAGEGDVALSTFFAKPVARRFPYQLRYPAWIPPLPFWATPTCPVKKENRLKFIILSVAVAELSLVLFGALPQPFNVFALFFNGLSLGCMWGVIFSFLEGRRVTDLLASLMGLSIEIGRASCRERV